MGEWERKGEVERGHVKERERRLEGIRGEEDGIEKKLFFCFVFISKFRSGSNRPTQHTLNVSYRVFMTSRTRHASITEGNMK